MRPLSPNGKAGPGMFSLGHSATGKCSQTTGALAMPGPPRQALWGLGVLTGQQLWKRSHRKPARVPGTSPLVSECEKPIKQLEPHVALLLRRAGVCALPSVISTEISVPLAAVGDDRQPHKPGSPAGHGGEKAKGGAGCTPPCSGESLQLEF